MNHNLLDGKLALVWSLRDRDDILPAALSSRSNRAQAMQTNREPARTSCTVQLQGTL